MVVLLAACISAVGSITAAVIAHKNTAKINGVHTLVNQQHSNLISRVDQLTNTLTNADIDVPPNGKGGRGDTST
jgi:hypothetical protein